MKTTVHPRYAAAANLPCVQSSEEQYFATPFGPYPGYAHWADINPDASQIQTQLGRLLATLPVIGGTIRLRCITKTELDQRINGHRPGTPEHAKLAAIWGMTGRPVTQTFRMLCSYWPNTETPAQYCDRLARELVGEWATTETFEIV